MKPGNPLAFFNGQNVLICMGIPLSPRPFSDSIERLSTDLRTLQGESKITIEEYALIQKWLYSMQQTEDLVNEGRWCDSMKNAWEHIIYAIDIIEKIFSHRGIYIGKDYLQLTDSLNQRIKQLSKSPQRKCFNDGTDEAVLHNFILLSNMDREKNEPFNAALFQLAIIENKYNRCCSRFCC